MWFGDVASQVFRFGKHLACLSLSVVLMGFSLASIQAGQNVTLAWSPSNDANTTGYKIYYGLASHTYTQSVDVGNVTNVSITVPAAGGTYYFAATAYNSSGVESDFSNEATFVIPESATLTSARLSSGQFSFTVNGTSGARYAILASTNLVDWFPVQTNTAPFTFVETNTAGRNRCFYRTVTP